MRNLIILSFSFLVFYTAQAQDSKSGTPLEAPYALLGNLHYDKAQTPANLANQDSLVLVA